MKDISINRYLFLQKSIDHYIDIHYTLLVVLPIKIGFCKTYQQYFSHNYSIEVEELLLFLIMLRNY